MTLPPAPAELSHLTRLIGDEATLALIERFGGTRLYVARDGGPLQAQFGEAAAAALASAWGGEYLKVPLARYWRARIYRARGLSYAKIARALGMTETTVSRLLNPAADRQRQLDLPMPTHAAMDAPCAREDTGGRSAGQPR